MHGKIMSKSNRVSSSEDSFELQPISSGSGGVTLSSDSDFPGFHFVGNSHPHTGDNSGESDKSIAPTTRFSTASNDNGNLESNKETIHSDTDIPAEDEDDWSSRAWNAIQKYESNARPDSSRFRSPETFWRKHVHIAESDDISANVPMAIQKVEDTQDDMENNGSIFDETVEQNESEDESLSDPPKPEIVKWKPTYSGLKLGDIGNRNSHVHPSNQRKQMRIRENAPSQQPLYKKKMISKKNPNKGIMRQWNRVNKIKRLTRRQRLQQYTRPITMYQRQWEPSYFHMFLDILYFCCLSPFKREQINTKTRLMNVLGIIQKITFGLFAVFATWGSIDYVHYSVLAYVENRTPANLFDIGYFLSMALVQIYLTYMLAYCQEDLSKLLHDWKFFECTYPEGRDEDESRSRKLSMKSLFLLCVIGSMPAILETVLYDGFNDWNLHDMMLQYSTDLTYTWNMWTATIAVNKIEYYENSLNNCGPSLYLWGTVSFFMTLLHRLIVDAERNLAILIAMKTLDHVNRFGRKAQTCINEMSPFVPYTEQDRQCWLLYRQTMNVNKSTNNLFSPLLNLTHLNNAFILSYAMSLFLKDDSEVFEIVFVSFEIAKAIYFYILAWQASKHNDTAKEWVLNLPAHNQQFHSRRVVYSNVLMLKELNEQPFGLGSGHFVINEVFLYRIGMVSVSLLSLALTSKFT